MSQAKQWAKTSEGHYQFTSGGEALASFSIDYKSSERNALVTINGEVFTIKQTNAWKNHMAVTNASNSTIITIVPEKWYSSSFNVQWGIQQYQLKVRNNPMAEWVLQQDGNDVLAYGLGTANGRAAIRITEKTGSEALLLHAILWYLFLPIAIENSGDNFIFTSLLAAQ